MQQHHFLMLGYTLTYTFISTLLFFTFYQLGASLLELSLYFAFMNLVPIIVITSMRSVNIRTNFILTFILMSLLALFLSTVTEKSPIILIGVITGVAFYLFWVPINILFFSKIGDGEHAFSSGKYYALVSIGRAIIPFFAGLLAAKYTHSFVYALASFIFALLILYAITLPTKKITYDLKKAYKSMRFISVLIFLEGMRGQIFFMAIPLFTLTFIHTELKLGAFLSYLGIAGIIAALILTKISDRQKKRAAYVYPITILLALFCISLFFARTPLLWGVASAVLFFLNALAGPFEITVLIDNVEDKTSAMTAREVLLASGRMFASLVIASVYLFTGTFYLSYLLIGTAYLLYPLIVFAKKVYATDSISASD